MPRSGRSKVGGWSVSFRLVEHTSTWSTRARILTCVRHFSGVSSSIISAISTTICYRSKLWNFGYAKLGLATAACNRLCSRIREHNRPEAELQRQVRLDRPRGALCAPTHRTGRDERCTSVIHARPGRGKKGAANINYGATM